VSTARQRQRQRLRENAVPCNSRKRSAFGAARRCGALLHAGSDWTSVTAAAPNLRLHVAYHHTAVPRELCERDTTVPLARVLATDWTAQARLDACDTLPTHREPTSV
jgi:hypothetical protein